MHQTPMEWWARKFSGRFLLQQKLGNSRQQHKFPAAQVPALSLFTSNVIRPCGLMDTLATHTAPVCCLLSSKLRVCHLLATCPAGKDLETAGFHERNFPEAGCGGWSCLCFPPALTCFNLHRLCLNMDGLLSPERGKPRHHVQLRNCFHPELFLFLCILSKGMWGCLKGVGVWLPVGGTSLLPPPSSKCAIKRGTLRVPHIWAFFTFPSSSTSNLDSQSGSQYKSILYTYINVFYFKLCKHYPVGGFSTTYVCKNIKRCVQKGHVCII